MAEAAGKANGRAVLAAAVLRIVADPFGAKLAQVLLAEKEQAIRRHSHSHHLRMTQLAVVGIEEHIVITNLAVFADLRSAGISHDGCEAVAITPENLFFSDYEIMLQALNQT